MELQRYFLTDAQYPLGPKRFLGITAPSSIAAVGNLDILQTRKLALFCSAKCPGDTILRAYDTARKFRDDGVTVVSGFHSSVEKECLRILLRGSQPIIACPARSLETMRLVSDWKRAMADGRLLILSIATSQQHRPTASLAAHRNEFVAALSDEVCFAHITPGGQMERLRAMVSGWNIPLQTLSRES